MSQAASATETCLSSLLYVKGHCCKRSGLLLCRFSDACTGRLRRRSNSGSFLGVAAGPASRDPQEKSSVEGFLPTA